MSDTQLTIHPEYPPSLGAIIQEDGVCRFRVWAPKAKQSVDLCIIRPTECVVPMQREANGYFSIVVEDVRPGITEYSFEVDGSGNQFPDPASRWQPNGVHQPSGVVEDTFEWSDADWRGIPLTDYIIYELHIGTFSEAGTFDSAIEHLDTLVKLGVTALEIMPVAQFPGGRNWGYDGVHPFAVQNTYGGPAALRRFVDACHKRGLAVILDVVYNHLGPEGNHLAKFGRYFKSKQWTPWGRALNFDGRGSRAVRRFFIENALYWIRDCHIDALRLDAVHAIHDQSEYPFLRELGEAVRKQGELLGRLTYTIAESNLNDPRMVRSAVHGGYALDGQWVDDLHHALHVELTGEQAGYYSQFRGATDLARFLRHGHVPHERYARLDHVTAEQLIEFGRTAPIVVSSQNHDQVGNRMHGERRSELADFEALKLAAALVILSPCIPLLFMGEEYAELAPFQYFVSHGDDNLIRSVRKGRRDEFIAFGWTGTPPDPQAEETFLRSRLNHSLRRHAHHAVMQDFYRELIRLRKREPSLQLNSSKGLTAWESEDSQVLVSLRESSGPTIAILFHFGKRTACRTVEIPPGVWSPVLNSAASRWNGRCSTPPSEIESDGFPDLTLEPYSLIVLKACTSKKNQIKAQEQR